MSTSRGIAGIASDIDATIVGDIKRASQLANVDFGYLMAQAAQESSFNPEAKAPSSSATGLFQFIDSTWLATVKQFGAKYGLGNLADQIQQGGSGYHVTDAGVRQQILDLRKDPKVSSELAAEFAHQNKEQLETALGRKANATDLYLAHFLGAQGATQFVKSMDQNASTKAADLMPAAAAANRSVFYDSNGQARTVAQVYQNFSARMERQIDQYASASGVSTDTAAEVVAMRNPMDLPSRVSQPMLAAMNVIALATLKLLGRQSSDTLSPDRSVAADKHRSTDTSA